MHSIIFQGQGINKTQTWISGDPAQHNNQDVLGDCGDLSLGSPCAEHRPTRFTVITLLWALLCCRPILQMKTLRPPKPDTPLPSPAVSPSARPLLPTSKTYPEPALSRSHDYLLSPSHFWLLKLPTRMVRKDSQRLLPRSL